MSSSYRRARADRPLFTHSIHKSQGQTLPRVKVDLGKVFEKGESFALANAEGD